MVKFLKGYQTWGNEMQTTQDGKVVMHAGFQPDAGMGSQGLARFTVPASSAQTPFAGSPFAVNSTIQAEDFDRGGEGIAYHDFDTTNNGGAYRPSEGVDIEATTDTGGGYDVGWTIPGDW